MYKCGSPHVSLCGFSVRVYPAAVLRCCQENMNKDTENRSFDATILHNHLIKNPNPTILTLPGTFSPNEHIISQGATLIIRSFSVVSLAPSDCQVI